MLVFGLIALTAGILAAEEAASPWGELARQDIEAAYNTIEAGHAGPVDDQNPSFAEAMVIARNEALARASDVESFDSYRMVLMGFADAFADGHLFIDFSLQRDQIGWPGFVAMRRGGHTVMRFAQDADDRTLEGARILSCDDRSADTIIAQNALPFRAAGEIEAAYARAAPYAFIYERNPFVTLPQVCEIETVGGEQQDQRLQWRWIETERWDALREEILGGAEPYGLSEYAPNRYWLSLPSFFPTGEDVTRLEALIDQLGAESETLLTAERLVIDVRGNSGGNSSWGRRIATALWGAEYLESRAPARRQRVFWRASQVTLHQVDALMSYNREIGQDHLVEYYERIHAGVAEAVEAGDPLWLESRGATRRAARTADNPMFADVIVLIDEGCASACLDFLDLLRPLDGVRFAGAETYADTIYNESMTESLPSGVARLVYTIKVIRDRPRGHNEPYGPDIGYEGADWSTEALQAWVETLPTE
jgi:hypothetical protein